MADFSSYLFGGICIVVYAWSRFNTPPAGISTTTKWQYWTALSGYVLAALGLWLVLAGVVATNPHVIGFLLLPGPGMAATGADADLESTLGRLSGLSAPLLSALFLTVLLPRLPILCKVDTALQRAFREIGAIPRRARQLSALLRRAPYLVPDDLRGEVARRLREQDLDPDRLLAMPRGTLEWTWVQIVGLTAKLEERVQTTLDPAFDAEAPDQQVRSEFVRHREVEYLAARAAYRRQAAIASLLLRRREREEGDPPPAVLARLEQLDANMRRLEQGFHEDCATLLKDLSQLISCGVLRSNFNLQGACRELAPWGFGPVAPAPTLLGVNDLACISLTVTGYMFALFLYLRHDDIGKVLLFSFLIGVIMALAALCALAPKKLRPRGPGWVYPERLEFALYLGSAALAVACWCGVHYVRIMLTEGKSAPEVLADLQAVYPIALIPAAAAFMIALLTDLDPEGWPLPRPSVRWAEGVAVGIALSLVAAVAVEWVSQIRAALPEADRPLWEPPPPHVIAVIQLGLGFIVGSLVPHCYRKALTRVMHEEAAGVPEARTAPAAVPA